MIQHLLDSLNRLNIILASTSPRRKQILQTIGLNFIVKPSDFEENLNYRSFNNIADFATETARQKAIKIAYPALEKETVGNVKPHLIVSADTVVYCDGVPIGKPCDENDAVEILTKLSGRSHTVVTGCALLHRKNVQDNFMEEVFYTETEVNIANLTQEIIRAYVDTGEPMDKAGAYGIQGIGGSFITSIVGDYYNVVGFPLSRFCLEINKLHKNNHLFT